MILLCDRSRSMLEARSLQARIAAMLLDGLTARDKFAVVAGDVRAHALAGGLHRADADDKAAAVAFLDADEPDGASDGAAARRRCRRAASARTASSPSWSTGDASPTWGRDTGGPARGHRHDRPRRRPFTWCSSGNRRTT
jgi:hypothetical protein